MENAEQLCQHGEFLRERNRYDEAIAAFKQALSQEPTVAYLHFQLAVTYLEHEDEKYLPHALETINEAIGLDPENDHYFAIKAMIYNHMEKPKDALKTAEIAISLYPENPLSWTEKGRSYFQESKWKEAEDALKRSLTIDPDFTYAKNLLSIAHAKQGNLEASEAEIASVLSQGAEDPVAHANAGWNALQRGERDKAETHFKEALRLDPTNEYARDGLRESYKARSLFFRLYLKYIFFMQRFSQGSQIAMMVGLYLAFKFGRVLLDKVHPALTVVLVILYLGFAFWTFFANGIGHFLLLKDPVARMSLNRKEKLDGLFVGGGLLIGIIIGAIGFLSGILPLTLIGGGFILGALPWSRVFINDSKLGQKLYGLGGVAIYALAIIGCGIAIAQYSNPSLSTAPFIAVAIVISVGSTWAGLIPGLNK